MSDKTPSDLEAATVETPPQRTSIEDQAAQILAEASAPPKDAQETEPQAEPLTQPETDWSLKGVAERLGTDAKTLYESLKVSMPDGSEVTLGAWKDGWQGNTELEKAREVLTEEATTGRKAVMEAEQQLGILVAKLGNQLTPEAIREVTRIAEEQRRDQSEKLLKALPDWKDPIKRAADWADIRKVGREAGFTEAELRLAAEGYIDHRLLVVLKRAAHRAEPEPEKPAAKKAAAPKRAADSTPAQQFGNLRSQVKAGRMRPEDAGALLLKGFI